MGQFLRNNAGPVILTIVGGVLATWVAQVLPNPVSDGAWWRNLLFQPVPSVVLVSYSVILVVALLLVTNRWRERDRVLHTDELAARRDELQGVTRERDSLRSKLAVRDDRDTSGTRPVSREALMRFVAVVLSDVADSTPKTQLHVCRSVAGLAGQGAPHADVGDALATMLHIGAVRPNYRELELASDWQAKLEQFITKQRTAG